MTEETKPSLKKFPPALPLAKLLGPSFIILALGLGSGEVILWPYLAANYGLGIAWGALLGITFQYFINMEIERYALVKGESVFVGVQKIWKQAPLWFIFSTFIGFGLPGIIASSATVVAHLLGLEEIKWLAIGLLLLIGLLLSLGKSVYSTVELITRTVLLIGVPFIFILAVLLSEPSDWLALASGWVGQGEGYTFLPEGIALTAFLGAFAYAGAGGNLNLTQSIYVKEKGYGMGKYAQKIASLFASQGHQKVKLTGEDFELNEANLEHFSTWWKRISIEHAVVFWFIGWMSMSLLMLLAYTTVFGQEGTAEGISFVIQQGIVIGLELWPLAGTLFFVAVGVMLFQTQLGILDSTSRIMGENYALKALEKDANAPINLSKIYYVFLWLQILFGIILFTFDITDPKFLLVLAAVLNAVAMFVHVGLVNWANYKLLPKQVQPAVWRRLILVIIFIFFGVFSTITIFSQVNSFFG
jgi:hypothetical protein